MYCINHHCRTDLYEQHKYGSSVCSFQHDGDIVFFTFSLNHKKIIFNPTLFTNPILKCLLCKSSITLT